MIDLHLYVKVNTDETVEQAISRTNKIMEDLFSDYGGFTVHEQGLNIDHEEYEEIKTFLSVDISRDKAEEILGDLDYYIYSY